MMDARPVVFERNLVFVSGKGGVGKTTVSQAIALRLNQKGKRVLWCAFEDPTLPIQELREIRPGLFHLNCEASRSFEEYAAMKIGVAGLARIFLQNKVVRYLSKAAPGIHELVLLGKVWHERENYDHVVVDMPSTGYGLAMFQSTKNFARLFQGGPIHRDAEEMLRTFNDPTRCGHLIVSLPEEMPLREALELRSYLSELFPDNSPGFLANRLFPVIAGPPSQVDANPDHWESPIAKDAADYVIKRHLLESFNLKIWDEEKISYSQLEYVPPSGDLLVKLAHQLESRGTL